MFVSFPRVFTCGVRDVLLDAEEGEQGEVGLLVEAQDALPVHVVLLLLVQGVEGEERRVEARQQDGEQQSRAAHHAAETGKRRLKGRRGGREEV